MNRFLTSLIVALIFLAGGRAVYFLLFNNPAPVQGPASSTPTYGGGSNQTTVTQQNSPDAQGALATYQKALASSNYPDNIKPQQTVVVGNYALQLWLGDHTGGEALLKFDNVQNKWTIVDPGGGAWSVEGLVVFGVPTTTAEALVARVPH